MKVTFGAFLEPGELFVRQDLDSEANSIVISYFGCLSKLRFGSTIGFWKPVSTQREADIKAKGLRQK